MKTNMQVNCESSASSHASLLTLRPVATVLAWVCLCLALAHGLCRADVVFNDAGPHHIGDNEQFPTLLSASGPYHIGDSVMPVCTPVSPSGVVYTASFVLSGMPDHAWLSLEAAHVNGGDPDFVKINGAVVGVLPGQEVQDCQVYDSSLSTAVQDYLLIGNNTLTVHCSLGSEYDDLFLRDIRITATCTPAGPTGVEYLGSFDLSSLPTSALLSLEAAHVDGRNPDSVFVNGVCVGILPGSSPEDCLVYDVGFTSVIHTVLVEGPNTVEIHSGIGGDGTYDDIYLRNIVVEAESVAVPFEILSAEFDQKVYRAGIDTAHLAVTTQSNGGEGALSISAYVRTHNGDEYSLGSDAFILFSGDQHESSFHFAIPSGLAQTHFDLDVSISRD